jgi:hypothetical protein
LLAADLVISPPRLLHGNGRPVAEKYWPIHEFLEACAIQRPVRLPAALAFLLATIYVPESILGSSASNLYRTQTLKDFPFPTDYGHVGDTAWGIRYSLRTSIAVSPETFSHFIFHRADTVPSDGDKQKLVRRLLDLARETVNETPGPLVTDPVIAASRLARIINLVQQLPDEVQRLHEAQRRYDRARRQYRPWVLSPTAWRARSGRNRQRSHLHQTQAQFWQLLEPDISTG